MKSQCNKFGFNCGSCVQIE